jgi:tight adherence protein B
VIAGLGAALVFAGVLATIVAVRARAMRRVHNLRQLVELSYVDEEVLGPRQRSQLLAASGMVAERALSQGLIERIRDKVERSDWTVGPGEFVAVSIGAGLVGLMLGSAGGSTPLGVLLALAGLGTPALLVNRSVERRRSRFEEQFPDVLDLLAASLESGASIQQAIELVVAEADDPAATEFARVLSVTRLGASLVDGLRAMAERIGSRDLTWTVQAIVVQQRTGGKLADVLRTVAEFMRGREELRRELRALTAEGKLSAYILGALPFAIAGAIMLFNPGYLTPLFTTLPGLAMVGGACALVAIGFVVMFKIIKVEV